MEDDLRSVVNRGKEWLLNFPASEMKLLSINLLKYILLSPVSIAFYYSLRLLS